MQEITKKFSLPLAKGRKMWYNLKNRIFKRTK